MTSVLDRQIHALRRAAAEDGLPVDLSASDASKGLPEAADVGYPGHTSKPAYPPVGLPPKSAPPFPISESKAASRLWRQGFYKLAYAVGSCGRSYAGLGCPKEGVRFFRAIVCRWPGCDNCKLEDSEAESRKVAKCLEKFDRAEGVGRVVLTLPQPVRDLLFRRGAIAREDFFDRALLNRLFAAAGAFGREVFGTEGVEVVLHPLGDSGGFNPHFEVLAPFWAGEWFNPVGCPVVRDWLLGLPGRWSACLQRLLPAADGIPATVQVNFKFADVAGRIVHRVKYAVDHHWSRKPHYIKTKGFRFLAALRGVRLARGFGRMDDRRWREWVLSKPYAHADAKEVAEEREGPKKCSLADGCPLCGCRLRFVAILQKEEMRWSAMAELEPGLWVDRARVREIRFAMDTG